MPLIAREYAITCGCGTYYSAPHGSADAEGKARNHFVFAIKDNGLWKASDPYEQAAALLESKHPDLFNHTTFVPIPSSKASTDPADKKATLHLARALAQRSKSADAFSWIERHTAIRKSSDLAPGETRPSVREHRETIKLTADFAPIGRIVLVDDVVTQGTQMIACQNLLRENGCTCAIDGIAVAYTKLRGDGTAPVEGAAFRYSWDGSSAYPGQRPALPATGSR